MSVFWTGIQVHNSHSLIFNTPIECNSREYIVNPWSSSTLYLEINYNLNSICTSRKF